jgi:hypothetical protein
MGIRGQVWEIQAQISHHVAEIEALTLQLESTISNYRWRMPTGYDIKEGG